MAKRKLKRVVNHKKSVPVRVIKISRTIEYVMAAFAITFLLGSLLLFSTGLTGYAVAETSAITVNFFGVMLFLVGLIAAREYFKYKK